MLVSEETSIGLSPLELERYGVTSARAYAAKVEDAELFDAYCEAHGVRLLIVRCTTANLDVIQQLEDRGSRIMDCLIYFQRDIRKSPPIAASGKKRVGLLEEDDVSAVIALAAHAFEGYNGHYHADRLLDSAKSDAVYRDWAARSCVDKNVANAVVVAKVDGCIAGFVTLKRHNADDVEAALVAVSPEFQGQGLVSEMIAEALEWTAAVGATRCISSTQISNIASQKVWIRNKFEPSGSYYTLHKWYAP